MKAYKKYIYLGLAILGLIMTWYYNLQFMSSAENSNLLDFIAQCTTTLPATSIAWDITVVGIVFFVWYIPEARKLKMKYWWAFIPLTLGVALAFAFPLFMFFREQKLEENELG